MSTTPTPQAHRPPEVDRLLDLCGEIEAGAADRERLRQSPAPLIRRLAEAGAGSLRIPVEQGGGGASVRELLEFVMALARADANIAQSLRSHYVFVEGRLAAADPSERERWYPVILAGELFGNGTVERHTKELFGFETRLTRDGHGYRLDGTKYYTTGTLYADHVAVMAVDDEGEVVTAVVPVDRDGVTLEDDWDAMGQRLTASGTTRFDQVWVAPDELLYPPRATDAPTTRTAFLQLYLVAVMAGIAAAAGTDAAALARRRTRTFSHGSGELPTSDPLIQQVVGEIDARAFACASAVTAAAEAIDAAGATGPEGVRYPQLCAVATRLTAQAQVVVADLAPRCGEALFNAGGASATSRELNLDRHWRNARTVASHNPAMYKARALGDLAINGNPLPNNGFF